MCYQPIDVEVTAIILITVIDVGNHCLPLGTLSIQSPEIIAISSTNSNHSEQQHALHFPPPHLSSDIWSLGCLLVEIITGDDGLRHIHIHCHVQFEYVTVSALSFHHYSLDAGDMLFADRSWADLYVNLCRRNFTEMTIPRESLRHSLSKLPTTISDEIERILLSILTQQPANRPSIKKIIESVENLLNMKEFKSMENKIVASDNGSEDDSALEQSIVEYFNDISSSFVHISEFTYFCDDNVLLKVEATTMQPWLVINANTLPNNYK
jgi:serine/threonine protein kinase